MSRKKMTEQEIQMRKTRILMIMSGHVGQGKRIGMGELYERVFEETYDHRINDTRRLRKLITELRRDGVAICSVASKNGGGYWLASAGSELETYCKNLRIRAIKILGMESRIRKISMSEMMGQMALGL